MAIPISDPKWKVKTKKGAYLEAETVSFCLPTWENQQDMYTLRSTCVCVSHTHKGVTVAPEIQPLANTYYD